MRLHGIGSGISILLVVSGLLCNFNSAQGMSQTPASSLSLHTIATIRLPGGSSRFDYQSLDEGRHLLFIAHLGAGMIHVVDTRSNTGVAAIHGIVGVHGVVVLPQLRRVVASATD